MVKADQVKKYRDYGALMRELKSGETSRMYLFFGEEKFLVEMALRPVKQFYLTSGAESLDFYVKDCSNSELEMNDFFGLVGTPPFMSRARVTVIKNSNWWSTRAPSSPKEMDEWKKLLSSIPEYALVIFCEDKVDKRKKQLLDYADQVGEVFEFGIQSEEELGKWIRKKFADNKITIQADCVSSLISRVDASMQMLLNEINKITLYCINKNVTMVDMNLLDRLSIPDVHASVFNMTDAIGLKDAGSALSIFNDLIRLKEPIPKVRLMLARHFRQLICAKELGDYQEVINQLKVRPFVARNLMNQARGFTLEQLERIYGLCFDSDQWVKTGRMEERTSMEVLLSAAGKI